MNWLNLLLGSLLKSGDSPEISFLAEHRSYWKTADVKISHWNFAWERWNIRGLQGSGTNHQFSKFCTEFDKFLWSNLNSGAWDAASTCSSGSLLNFS